MPQEPELPPDCTAEEWIFLGHELRGRLRWLRQTEMRARAAALVASGEVIRQVTGAAVATA